MKTGLITSDTYQKHNTGDGHPEKIDRVAAVIDNFKKIDNKELIWKKPIKFDQSFLINTHSSKYIDLVSKSFPENGLAFLDGDTVVSPGSKDASKDAVGSIISAIDGVQQKKFKNAFCAVRPPGHHAEKDKAMGFCIYNNVAVGANYLIKKYNYNLQDLQSRINSFTFIGIELPTDDLLQVIITKSFSDKQINLNPKISEYIIKNIDRSYEKMFKYLKDIDELSLSTGKSININLIKKVLKK